MPHDDRDGDEGAWLDRIAGRGGSRAGEDGATATEDVEADGAKEDAREL